MKIILENRFKDAESRFDISIIAIHEKSMFIMFNDSDDMERFIDYFVESADEDIRQNLINDMMIGKENDFVGIPFHYFNKDINFLIYDNDAFISKK